jgi:mitochondrial enoyl-[acyl-carrier protein] reductase / trans-2-enoyl-CoA reductase
VIGRAVDQAAPPGPLLDGWHKMARKGDQRFGIVLQLFQPLPLVAPDQDILRPVAVDGFGGDMGVHDRQNAVGGQVQMDVILAQRFHQSFVRGLEALPHDLVVTEFDPAADELIGSLPPDPPGKRGQHPLDPAPGFSEVGNLRLDDDGDPFRECQGGPVDHVGEAVLEVEVAPIEPADLYRATGEVGEAFGPLPYIGGLEGMGRVVKVGPGIGHIRPGDRVLLPIAAGAWQQRIRVPAANLFPLPPNADPLQIGQLSVNPPTAYALLHDFVELKRGDIFIHNAANSNVGRYLIRLGQHLGLQPINIVRRESAVEPLRQASGEMVFVDGPDLPERIAAATGNAPIQLALDAVAGEATQRLAACLAEGGTLVTYGKLSKQPCVIPPEQFLYKNIHHRGFFLVIWFRESSQEKIAAAFGTLAGLIAQGVLKAEVEATYPLSQIRDALAHAMCERNGRILVMPN